VIKLLKRILSKRRNRIILYIFILIAVGFGNYLVKNVEKNITRMFTLNEEAPAPYFPPYPAVTVDKRDPALIKRGEYLTKAGDCLACHTNSPEKGKPFAGGLPMQTPFGIIYTPNITPDKKTGIGNWTADQFVTAMREGISPNGHHYYPAFPYLYFNKVSTEDLLAIKIYLDSIPAVSQKNKPNAMIFPFNIRFLQSGWRLLFFNPVKTGPYQPNPRQSVQWNRGAYLVEGLGHCAMCHTPSYHVVSEKIPLGAPMRQYNLTGAKIQGFLAPNITKANLDKISEEELIKVFTHNRLIGGGQVEGPMLEANQNSLRYLTHTDLLAIATYLKSVQSKSPPLPKGGIGKAVYENYCSGCHISGAGGAPKFGDAMTWAPVLQKDKEIIYKNAMKGIGGMPAKGTCLSCQDQDIKAAVDYMLKPVMNSRGKMTLVKKQKKLTAADGKRIYEKNCSVCHTSGYQNAPMTGDKKVWKPIIDAGFLAAYTHVATGAKHPQGACINCTDEELLAAVKYIMQQGAPNKNYTLW